MSTDSANKAGFHSRTYNPRGLIGVTLGTPLKVRPALRCPTNNREAALSFTDKFGEVHPERRVLVVVRGDHPGEVTNTTQLVRKAVDNMARGKSQLAFNSADASLVGIYAIINKPLPVLRAALEGFSTYKDRGFVLVLELGDDFTGVGNSSGWQWLQNNLVSK